MDEDDIQRKLEWLERELEQTRTRADQYQARADRYECLYNVHVTISPALVAESDTSSKVAKDDTNVGNKVYPSILRPWAEFPALHDARFGLVLDALGDSKLFPSIVDVRSTLRDLSPTPRFDEQDVRPFIRVHVESPARKIVNAYFKAHQGSSTVALELRNNAYGLRHNTPSMSRDEDQPPGEQQLPEIPSSLAPDRWGVRVTDRKVSTAVLIGEYKAAHKARAQQGYVASGECLVVLVIKDAANVLYFDFVSSLADIEEDVPTADTVKCTPAAAFTTLTLLALEADIRPQKWIQEALAALPRWPSSGTGSSSQSLGTGGPSSLPPPPQPPPPPWPPATLPPPSLSGDNDKQGGTPSSRQSPQNRHPTKRTREEGEERNPCLLGLSSGGALDPRCPNTPRHTRQDRAPYHTISKAELCSLFRSQFAYDLDHGCECLDRYGMFGETGVLFKITLLAYGYTLVAKGVQVEDAHALVAEAAIYSHCRRFQGVYIPVHLGAIELVVPYYTQSLAVVTHMMLMSWAGTSLKPHIPEGIDLERRTEADHGHRFQPGICI
ncbi:hypothetical protein CHGG_05168 [Chaetomium globosum CBS 148.51]|uniref:Uncharacterized protein n=1 Tax=Chaetomium globosum (strain ATCC 6205 / CBS 148.51 / DSM 1962 / NBRC 6347 / NRRL 1970) TaxID=306901 RepID=Q2GZ78_CHAGB|nr:uncharacterized protein CHGG_05168 [Chaetomium globosum CBS 148.51]EAQ88549.1 hypothetical protein CHGG_05168 [Chaetomium globosum CBS 148.51]